MMKATQCLHIIILSIIIATIQIQAMEYDLSKPIMESDIQQKLLSPEPNYQFLPNHESHYEIQLHLPDDALDKIIAYSHNNRQNLKETCKQLSFITSINRLDQFIMHDFIIGNKKEKAAFFKALIKTSNPHFITTIMQYAQKEAQHMFSNAIPNAICIIMESKEDITAQENAQLTKYIQEHYLYPLLKEALEQDNTEMIARLKEENYDTSINDIERVCFVTSIGTVMCGIFGFVIYVLTR